MVRAFLVLLLLAMVSAAFAGRADPLNRAEMDQGLSEGCPDGLAMLHGIERSLETLPEEVQEWPRSVLSSIHRPERALQAYADVPSFEHQPWNTTGAICDECTQLIGGVMEALGSNATLSQIEEILDLACFLVPLQSQKQCRAAVASLLQSLQATDKSFVEDYTPYQFCSALSLCFTYCCITPYFPQGIHLSLTENPQEVWVMWSTQLEGMTPTVQYGLAQDSLTMQTIGNSSTYWQGGWKGYIYRVQLSGLQPDTVYYYRVGDPDWEWGQITYAFRTAPDTNTGNVSIALYGDMGNTDISNKNIYWLSTAATEGKLDMVMHLGDIGYADAYEVGWDLFLNKIEPIAAVIPYMTTVGNHEVFYDFTGYRYRFQMPVQNLDNINRLNVSLYYSFNYGNVHFISFSLEEFFGLALNMLPGNDQYNWLLQDLQQADANRDQQPWIVMTAHRPLYCTTDIDQRCTGATAYYRSMIEPLIHQYKVDLVFGAHLHNYERTYPVYNSTVYNPGGSSSEFVNPEATIYLVVGTGGNKEGLNKGYINPAPSWSVQSSRIAEWGYGVLELSRTNQTCGLTWTFLSQTDNGVLDSFTITKETPTATSHSL